MNPRASAATTKSTASGRAHSASRVTAASSAPASSSSGVMSLKTIPGFGKSGMSRMNDAERSSRDPPQVPDQQQMLQVRGDGREVLQRLDGLRAGAPGCASAAPGARICCSSAASRSAEVLNTRRLRPATPYAASSLTARTISRSVSS